MSTVPPEPNPASPPELSPDERDLGMDREITRRDFVNAVGIGTGAALLGAGAPIALPPQAPPSPPVHPWTGYGGVGDYARSNGNTWESEGPRRSAEPVEQSGGGGSGGIR